MHGNALEQYSTEVTMCDGNGNGSVHNEFFGTDVQNLYMLHSLSFLFFVYYLPLMLLIMLYIIMIYIIKV